MAKLITCKGYRAGNPAVGYDFDCEYEHAGEITCDQCLCNGGDMSPVTGKRFRGNLAPYIRLAEEDAVGRHVSTETITYIF